MFQFNLTLLPSNSVHIISRTAVYCVNNLIILHIGHSVFRAMLWIRIRMFLGLPDQHPVPLLTRTDLDPASDPSIISKNSKKNLTLISILFYDFIWLFAVFRIRIRRIRMFLGLPDPLDRGTGPRIRMRIRIRTKMSRIHNTASEL